MKLNTFMKPSVPVIFIFHPPSITNCTGISQEEERSGTNIVRKGGWQNLKAHYLTNYCYLDKLRYSPANANAFLSH